MINNIYMKKQLLFIALLIFSIQSVAQFSIFSRYFPYNQKTSVYPITSNPDKGLPMIFVSGKDVKIVYLSAEGEFRKEILIKRTAKNARLYLGSYIADNSLVITFSDDFLMAVSQLIVDLSTGDFAEIYTDIGSENGNYLASWELRDSLFVLSVVENSNRLLVTKFFDGEIFLMHEFNFGANFMVDNQMDIMGSLFDIFDSKEGNLQKIDYSIPVSLSMASVKNKVYLTHDELRITIDYFDNITYVLSLNLIDGTKKIAVYPYVDLHNDEEMVDVSNSFLYNNNIFQLRVNKYELGLNIHDLVDSTRSKYYHVLRGDKIDFLNSELYMRNEKEGFLFGNAVVTELGTSRRFLRLLSGMKPAISVFSKGSNFQILIGGVRGIHQSVGVTSNIVLSSGGEMVVSPSGSMMMPDPAYNFASNFSFSAYSSQLSAYFSSVIDTSSFTHVETTISKYTYDYIIEYANYMSGRYGLVSVFKMKGDYYLGYYSYSNQTYNIEWFKNIDEFSVQY